VIFGWWVVNRQHNKREERKEVRAALNALYELLNQIEADAFDYHTSEVANLSLSRKIKRQLSQIYTRVNLAFQNVVECNCARDVTTFRQAVTLQNFDDANHKALEPSDPLFDSITAAKERLVAKVEQAFVKHYRR